MIPYLIDVESVFDFSSVKGIDLYHEVASSIPRYYPPKELANIVLGKLDLASVKPYQDALFLEELNYRVRIFLVTNLPKLEIKSLLMRHNLDVFVQDVISPEDVNRYLPSQEIFSHATRRANTVLGVMNFVTPRVGFAIKARSLGLKVTLLRNKVTLPQDLGIGFKPDLVALAESVAQHKVDSTMGDSALRCT
ncbi:MULTISPECIES: HAD family hydrolase [Metallosphaera]|uniref:HAD family hydrolase n=1 Tax=Metallosphaera TaxID=41980 RepID=UPI001F062305|nr:HAD family hydrolase [Metallosphaera sedula]MCH1772216.1 HAD family hydrolase [Metallosphaera sedula]MCP6728417.1 HAD family hydrolase [Metallosphaera sedula]BBL46836.1 2-haloalkanoic acid dehalogenase [Metallosphaera sedula]